MLESSSAVTTWRCCCCHACCVARSRGYTHHVCRVLCRHYKDPWCFIPLAEELQVVRLMMPAGSSHCARTLSSCKTAGTGKVRHLCEDAGRLLHTSTLEVGILYSVCQLLRTQLLETIHTLIVTTVYCARSCCTGQARLSLQPGSPPSRLLLLLLLLLLCSYLPVLEPCAGRCSHIVAS
jgi:hypothetical protein